MKIPSNWSQVTIRDYANIISLNDIKDNPIEHKIHLITALTGAPLSEVRRLPVSEFNKAVSALKFLEQTPKDKLKVRFKIKGVEYQAVLYIHQLNAGQYIDLMTYCSKPEEINENLAKIMACYCLPLKRKWYGRKYTEPYDGSKVPERAKIFADNLTMDLVFPIADFFLNTLKNLMPSIKIYLERQEIQLKQTRTKMKARHLLKNGVGLS